MTGNGNNMEVQVNNKWTPAHNVNYMDDMRAYVKRAIHAKTSVAPENVASYKSASKSRKAGFQTTTQDEDPYAALATKATKTKSKQVHFQDARSPSANKTREEEERQARRQQREEDEEERQARVL